MIQGVTLVEVRMTMEEFMELVNKGALPGMSELPGMSGDNQDMTVDMPMKRSRKKTARDRAMKIAVKEANARYRKKNGELRQGRTQADVMRLANKLADRMMK